MPSNHNQGIITNSPSPTFTRLVLFLVDALRSDMVIERHEMRFLRSLVHQNNGTVMVAEAHAPTVTLPRIKALMTGTIPQFADLFNNLNDNNDDHVVNDDNLISLLKQHKKRIVLYGDDTWERLFPRSFESHSDPTTSSFFTPDFIQVDENVTRHLDEDFDPSLTHTLSKAWDVSILHYLGLDHIGHQLGPDSPRMSRKLVEMDQAFERVFHSVQQQDAMMHSRTLIVLLSDHGMNQAGNHGGSSKQETSAVVLFVPASTWHNVPSVSTITTTPLPSFPAFQVDVAVTLGLLMNVGIPRNSLGCPMVNAFTEKSHERDLMMKNSDVIMQGFSLLLREHDETNPTFKSCVDVQHKVLAQHAPGHGEGDSFIMWIWVAIEMIIIITACCTTVVFHTQRDAMLVSLVHGISIWSSSAIENEHATWGFLTSTLLGVVALRKARQKQSLNSVLICMLLVRVLRIRLEIVNFSRTTLGGSIPPSRFVAQDTGVLEMPWMLITPWAMGFSVIVVAWSTIQRTMGKSSRFTTSAATMSWIIIILSKIIGGNGDNVMWSRFALALIVGWASMDDIIYGPLIALLFLIQRVENWAILSLSCLLLYHIQNLNHVALLTCAGRLVFYALGNSHSVATIDISGGNLFSYMYMRDVVALVTTVTVYSGPMLAAMLGGEMVWCMHLISACISTMVTIAMRNHLFVWSVFVPKWAYESLGLLVVGSVVLMMTSRSGSK